MKGKVKRWLRSRGYGLIEPENGGKDILVRHSDLIGLHKLKPGDKVEFEVVETRAGPKAINVKLAD